MLLDTFLPPSSALTADKILNLSQVSRRALSKADSPKPPRWGCRGQSSTTHSRITARPFSQGVVGFYEATKPGAAPPGDGIMVETAFWLGAAEYTATITIGDGPTAAHGGQWEIRVNGTGLRVLRHDGGGAAGRTVGEALRPVLPGLWNLLRLKLHAEQSGGPAAGRAEGEGMLIFLNPSAVELGRVVSVLNVSAGHPGGGGGGGSGGDGSGGGSGGRLVSLVPPDPGFVMFDYISVLPFDGGVLAS